MAIEIKDVRKAMQLLEQGASARKVKAIHGQLAFALECSKQSAEYSGTLESALSCLKLAGYEIQNTALKGFLSDEKDSPSGDMDNE